ncbi:hypothetical protein FACS1894122_07810 [Alphaproteobacteria bacterium]|nr:hypothetical protein FACS1894122_07810 [Alphaproteobacteria bacterium]
MFTFKFLRPAASQTPLSKSGKNLLMNMVNELMARSVSRHTLKKGSRLAKTAIGITAGQRYEKYSDAEKRVISESINDYGEYADHIFIHEGIGDIGVKNIKSSVEKHLLFTGRRPVIFIDYLQMLAPHNDRYTDKQNMDKAVLELKRISREFKVPVVVISSLNRSSYSQGAKMEAFKESGAIEYSADVLLGLQYKGAGSDGFDINDAKSRDPREIEIKILKNRNGKTGDSVGFRYYAMFNYFECEPHGH